MNMNKITVGHKLWNWVRLSRLVLYVLSGLFAMMSFGHLAFAQDDVLIRGASIFSGKGDKPFQADVLITKGRIAAIEKNISAPNARVVDARGLSLLPGLIDVHVHWTAGRGRDRAAPAAALLRHGVTTATDYHSAPESYAPKREAHKSIPSPHLVFIARMSTPGGHGADWGDENMTRTVVSEQDAREAVKKIEPYRPDAIKVFTDGWRYGSGTDNTSINGDALSAVVEEAKRMRVPVLTHTVTVDGAKIAAGAGVTTIAHAIQNDIVDAELLKLMKDNEVRYAPTLAVYEPKPENLKTMPAHVRQRVMSRQSFSQRNLQLLTQAGVKLAVGTDSGIGATEFGESTLRELELLVEFGVSPKNALIAGTAGSADALMLSEDRGTISVGKRADLILVKGRPWEKISDIRNIQAVFVDGQKLVEGSQLLAPSETRQPVVDAADALIDDFESRNAVTISGAVRLKETDSGFPRSNMIQQVVSDEAGNRTLLVQAEMAVKDRPQAFITLPLSQGSFSPKNASGFNGVRFKVRGEGSYQVKLETESGVLAAPFKATAAWEMKEIAFEDFMLEGASLKAALDKVYAVKIGGIRAPGTSYWLEIDDVSFF